MKKVLFAIAVLAATVGCSRTSLVNEPAEKESTTPISFGVEKQNITKAAALQSVKHYNFGVWAWKVQGSNSLADQEVMNNYLVGWSGTIVDPTDPSKTLTVGYDHTNATTYAEEPGTTADHTSPWFYEKLGTAEYLYEGSAGYYKKTDSDYTSKNTNQYLRYWDLAYAKTNFYCYAPYNKNVSFEKKSDNSVMTFPATAIRDGYDLPLNSAYANYSRTLGEYMYAGVQATNASLADVTVPFKHMGAQLFIRFYEDIPGYKVELINLCDDHGTTSATGDMNNGIQATPSIKSGTSYSNGTYYTTQGATVSFAEATAVATYTASWGSGASTATNTTPLMFRIPQTGTAYETYALGAHGNLTEFAAPKGNTTSHNVIKEKATEGAQAYSYSPTVYYPVAQPTTSTTGFTFHVSYRIIAEDNGEVITVHNATVHVPVTGTVIANNETDPATASTDTQTYITAWQPNVKYTYTFKITRNASGTTNPGTVIDPTNPTPSDKLALYPIVFDAATIEDYATNYSEYTVSEDTSY